MSQELHNSLVDLGSLSKPADTLIKKVSKAVGGFFEPYQIKRRAKAKAEAAIIMAQSEIQITDLHQRAAHRLLEEEAQHQKNMEDITAKAVLHLNEGANPDLMEDDWIANFFDKSRIVSDGEMQDLWARVLAGEANASGTFSKRTVNFLSDLDKVDAELFTKVCGFCWWIGEVMPLVVDVEDRIYTKHGINFASLSHLDSIGLIQFGNIAGFRRFGLPQIVSVYYFGKRLLLKMPHNIDNQFEIGNTRFTKIGQELVLICESKPVDGFWDYAKRYWRQYLPAEESE